MVRSLRARQVDAEEPPGAGDTFEGVRAPLDEGDPRAGDEIDDGPRHMVGHNLRSYIESLEKQMREAASNLEFETAGRLRDEIRSLESEELGLPASEHKAPVMGRSNEGKPGTRKTRYGKQKAVRMAGTARKR